jgi:photosystem II stability/assembly factor-like uncharacterized protein
VRDRPPFRRAGSPLVCLLLSVWVTSAAAQEASAVYAWEDRGLGLESSDVTAVAASPDHPDDVFVGAGGSLFRSRDGGRTWERVLTVRGLGAHSALDLERDDAEEDEIDETLLRDAAEEAVATIREELIAELEAEFGAELAEEIADEAVDGLVDEILEDPAAELPDEVDRLRLRERLGEGGVEDLDEFEEDRRRIVEDARTRDEDRIHRIDIAEGSRVAVATTAGLFLSQDLGDTFRQVTVALGEVGRDVLSVRWDPHVPERLYAGTEDGVWVSADAGLSFSRGGGISDRGGVQDVAVDPRMPGRVLAATQNGLFRSPDGGLSFAEVWTPSDEAQADVRAVDFDGRLPDRIYAGTAGGLLRSIDGGETFERIEPPGLTTREIQDVRAWPYRAGAVAVATSVGVFASGDGGQHFHEAFPGLPARDVVRVAPIPDRYPELLVATPNGLYRWERMPDVMPRTEWIDVVVRRGPPLPEIVRAAERWAGLESSQFEGAYRRASRAWLLPQVSGALRYQRNDAIRHIQQEGTPTRFQRNLPDDQIRWNVWARWDLDDALHSDKRLAVTRTWLTQRRERDRILARVTASYASWVSLSVRAIQVGPRDLQEATLLALQIQEAEAHLDALTGGFFTQALHRRPDLE